MSREQKRWAGVLLGAGVLVLLLLGLATRQQPPQVNAARVKRESLDAWISSNGKVEPLVPYAMRAQLDAFVKQVPVVEGQSVKRGQLLLELDVTATGAQLAQARQGLLAAQEDLRNARAGGPPEKLAELETDLNKTRAKRDHLRQQQASLERLLTSHAATQDEASQNKLELERADADLNLLEQRKREMARQAQLETEQASLRVQQTRDQVRDLEQKVASARVMAPVDGTLYSLPARAGQYERTGETLLEMADLHRVRVRAFVDEPDLGWLEPNEMVQIAWDAKPNESWNGETEQVPKQVVPRANRSFA
jgi:HlyD family secretion protein